MADLNDPHELVHHLMEYRKPETQELVTKMEFIRDEFISLGVNLADELPAGPDKTVAIRKLHEALMSAIACLALNQPKPVGKPRIIVAD